MQNPQRGCRRSSVSRGCLLALVIVDTWIPVILFSLRLLKQSEIAYLILQTLETRGLVPHFRRRACVVRRCRVAIITPRVTVAGSPNLRLHVQSTPTSKP